jgi:DNA polymerase (family 10)
VAHGGAKRHRVVQELNSYPDRLDLNDLNLPLAKEMGVMVTISTDSHSAQHLEHITLGVHTARRGWLEKDDILNTLHLKDLLRVLKK